MNIEASNKSRERFLSVDQSRRLKTFMRLADKTQVEVAAELEPPVSRSYLNRMLNGLEPKNQRIIEYIEQLEPVSFINTSPIT